MNKKTILEYIIIVIVVVLIRTFLITPAKVDGSSMVPTLHNGNFLLLNKIKYTLNGVKRFDIVVIKHDNKKLVKRVVGLPGEHIAYKDNKLYINNIEIEEGFSHLMINDFKLEDIGFLVIPGDKYFLVGDNRENSLDSRVIGLVDKKDILGITNFRLFPFNKIGKFN